MIWAALGLLILAQGAASAGEPAKKLTPSERTAIEGVVKDYIAQNPEIVLDALKALEAKERTARQEGARNAILAEQSALKRDPASFVAGNPAGDVTLVEFFDYNCGYCRAVVGTIQSLLSQDKKLRLVLKEWPIRGSDSQAASRVSLAATKQSKFLAFHFALLSEKDHVNEAVALATAQRVGLDMDQLRKDMKSIESDQIFARNEVLAQKIGIEGTPGFVVGQSIIPGAVNIERFKQLIAEVRTSCKTSDC